MVPSTFSESFNSSILTVAAQRPKCTYLYSQIIRVVLRTQITSNVTEYDTIHLNTVGTQDIHNMICLNDLNNLSAPTRHSPLLCTATIHMLAHQYRNRDHLRTHRNILHTHYLRFHDFVVLSRHLNKQLSFPSQIYWFQLPIVCG